MEQHGPVFLLGPGEHLGQLLHIVAVYRAHVGKAHFFKHSAFGQEVALEPVLHMGAGIVQMLFGGRVSLKLILIPSFKIIVPLLGAEAGQVAAETAHIGVDRHTVIIENNDHGLPGGAGIVEPLEAEAAGHGTVADQGDNAVILVEQGSGVGHAQGHRNGVGGVACDEGIMLALIGLWKARKTAQLPQCMKQRLSPGQNLMAVALVSHIKNQTVLGGVKHPMDSHRQLHNAQVGGQMTTGFRHIFHQKVPKLPAKPVHLGTIQ